MNSGTLLVSALFGTCVAGAAWLGRDSFAAALDYVESDLRDRMRSLRIVPRQLRAWLYLWLAAVSIAFCVMWLAFDLTVLGGLLAVLLSTGPWYIVRRLSQIRREKIEDQLADAMGMFSGAIRAGLSMPQSMELLAGDCPQPIRQEFRQVSNEYQLGKPLERVLEEAKQRLRSENFVLFAAALLASRASGGKLNETVERIARSVVELQRLERKVRAETAQARKSAVYMAIVPFFLLVVYYFMDPNNTRLLFVTLPGQLMLSVSVLLNLAAYLWALRILRADI